MIYDTLAAIADWNNNRKIDNNASVSECLETITDLATAGKLNTNSDMTIMNLGNGKTRVTYNLKLVSDTFFIEAMQHKTPRSVIQPDMDYYDNRVFES